MSVKNQILCRQKTAKLNSRKKRLRTIVNEKVDQQHYRITPLIQNQITICALTTEIGNFFTT